MAQGSYGDGFDSGMSFGNAIVLDAGREYSLRLVVKGTAPAVTVTVRSDPTNVAFSRTFAATSDWETIVYNFSAPDTSMNSTLIVTSASPGGDWWLGGDSLTPTANTWRGMRKDVVENLRQTDFHGLFRYPGGCYAPFYRWKIGLLDPDERPPTETPPQYCAAVAGGVNAYTDGMMENGPVRLRMYDWFS